MKTVKIELRLPNRLARSFDRLARTLRHRTLDDARAGLARWALETWYRQTRRRA